MTIVLLIEDDPNLRGNLADILSAENYEVEQAVSADQAFAILFEQQLIPDLIISDICLSSADEGFSILERVKQTPHLTHIPFIFLTARTETSHIREGFQKGVDDYLTKPCSASDLLSSVRARRRAKSDLISDKSFIPIQATLIIEQAPHLVEGVKQLAYRIETDLTCDPSVIHSIGRSPKKLTRDQPIIIANPAVNRNLCLIRNGIDNNSKQYHIIEQCPQKHPKSKSLLLFDFPGKQRRINRLHILKHGDRIMIEGVPITLTYKIKTITKAKHPDDTLY